MSYFLLLGQIVELLNVEGQLGLFKAGRRHSLLVDNHRIVVGVLGAFGTVETSLNQLLARVRCYHRLKLSRRECVNMSSF